MQEKKERRSELSNVIKANKNFFFEQARYLFNYFSGRVEIPKTEPYSVVELNSVSFSEAREPLEIFFEKNRVPLNNADELNKDSVPTSELNSVSFSEARKQLDVFFKKEKKQYRHLLNEEEIKLIANSKALVTPISDSNFRMKLSHSLFKNPNTGQLFDICTKHTLPSLLDISLSQVKAMKIKGQLGDGLMACLPEELIEKVNDLATYRKNFNP